FCSPSAFVNGSTVAASSPAETLASRPAFRSSYVIHASPCPQQCRGALWRVPPFGPRPKIVYSFLISPPLPAFAPSPAAASSLLSSGTPRLPFLRYPLLFLSGPAPLV